MAGWAITNKIFNFVRSFPVIIKFAPRGNVMNIKRSPELFFCYTAVLAGIVIASSCPLPLFMPVRATPFLMTALPIAMIFALLPSGCAFIGTEPFNPFTGNIMTPYPSLLAALFAFVNCVFICPVTNLATILGICTSFINRIRLPAVVTDQIDVIPTALSTTFVRTKTIHAIAAIIKLFPTIFTSLLWASKGLPKTLAGAIKLRRATWLKFLATNYTIFFSHIWIFASYLKTRPGTIFLICMFWIAKFLSAGRADLNRAFGSGLRIALAGTVLSLGITSWVKFLITDWTNQNFYHFAPIIPHSDRCVKSRLLGI